MKSLLNISNILTFSRIILVIPYILLLFNNNFICFLIALVILIVGGFTDFLDGFFARLRNEVTEFGRFFDPLADKIFIISILISLLIYNNNLFPFWLVIIIIVRDFIISDVRFSSIEDKKSFPTILLAKLKTVFLFITIISSNILIIIDSYLSSEQNILNYIKHFNSIMPNLGNIISFLPTLFLLFAVYFSIHSCIIYLIKNKHIFYQ